MRSTPTAAVPRMYRLEGHGMVTEDYVRDVLGPRCRFKVYPVIDIEGMAPVDAYEIPDRHRRAVQILTPADTFPYGACLSQRTCRTTTPSLGPARATGPVTHRELRTPDHHPPPDQDPRPVAGPATLPRDLRMARPVRRLLPRRQHRHPPHHPTRGRPRTSSHGRRDLPQPPRHRARLGRCLDRTLESATPIAAQPD